MSLSNLPPGTNSGVGISGANSDQGGWAPGWGGGQPWGILGAGSPGSPSASSSANVADYAPNSGDSPTWSAGAVLRTEQSFIGNGSSTNYTKLGVILGALALLFAL